MPSGSRTVWFMTENPGKFREASSILESRGIRIRQLRRSKLEIQDERLEKIATYALKKALEHHPGPMLVEDSGLFIEALRGFPGPFSSHALQTIGLNGILHLLGNSSRRKAYFRSAVAFGSNMGELRTFTGVIKGTISREILGSNGFGFDPIFLPDGSTLSFGQADDSFKNSHSHRAKALLKFASWYRRQGPLTRKIALK